jgi:SAM-dependent methyltransferase
MSDSFYVEHPYPLQGNHGGVYERELRSVFEPLAPRHVLDAGCGTGAMSRELACHFPDASIVGVDRSASAIALASQRHGRLPNVTFEVLDLEQSTPDSATKFDFVFCQGVLHHMGAPVQALRNIHAAATDEMTGYVWLYSEHGRVEIRSIRDLLGVLSEPGETVAGRLNVLDLIRPAFRNLHESEEKAMAGWSNGEPGWTATDERRARDLDRYVNPVADHYSVAAAADLFRSAGFEIVSAPTLDAVTLPPALAALLDSRGLDMITGYSSLERIIRPWGIGYLIRKSR